MAAERVTILVVDDEEEIRFLLGMVLDEAGYEVKLAEDGTKGLEMVASDRPELVFLDLVMRGLGGRAVLERLRALPDAPSVVIVTGAHDEVARIPTGPPVAGFLLKPFRVEEILLVARKVLEARHPAPEPPQVHPGERRRETRRPLLVEAKLLGRDGDPIARGTIVNLSRSGAQFHLGFPMGQGRTVELALEVPGMAHPVTVAGEIRWSKEGALGVKFKDLTPEQARWVEELIDGSE